MSLRLLILSIGALGAWAPGAAYAQGFPGGTGVSSEIERTSRSSPQDKLSYAEDSNFEIREGERQISRLLEQARRDGDIDAIECLISRVTSLRALLGVSQGAEGALRDAITAGEDAKADHEFRKIAVAVSKTRMLLAEAQRCAADQELESGTTIVEWDENLVESDPFEENQVSDFDISVDPPDVSPFL